MDFVPDWGNANPEHKNYRRKDLEKFVPFFNEAQQTWREKTVAHVKKHGDTGTCIIGDGIFVNYIPPRCRKAKPLKVVSPQGAQGSYNYEQFKDEIMEYLRREGVDCYYRWGRMD